MQTIKWLGIGLLAWQVGGADRAVAAGRPAARAALAFVDPAGRVLPGAAPATPAETARTTPCADAVALSADAARALVGRIAAEEEFYPDFVLSVAKIESRYVSTALSERGAYGLMQLMPDTARRFSVDRCDPAGNVRGGIRYLRALHARLRNPFFILAAYNAGEEAVRRARGVPANPETVRYVADVMNDFYTWPNPAGEKSRTLPSTSADLVEVGPNPLPERGPAADGAESAPGAQAQAGAHWDGGFVLHVE